MASSPPERPGAGGTPGGVGTFLLGLLMAGVGAYLLTNNIRVSTSFWGFRYVLWGGYSITAFGVTLLLFLLGVGLLFVKSSSVVGWLLTLGSLVFILVGVLVNLEVYFAPTSLYVTLVILALLAGGVGLIIRSLRTVRLPDA